MTRKMAISWMLALVVVMGFAVATAFGSPAAIGSLVGSESATLDGQAALPHTTVLSGDRLRVSNGVAMVSLNEGNRMILGRGSVATFLKEADGLTVSLNRGNMMLYHPQASAAFHVKVGDVTVQPAKGYRTLGEVAMADGLLLVMAKDGTLQVEKAGKTEEVCKGKMITIGVKAADAPAPTPQGNRHIKHIASLSPAALLLLLGSTSMVGWTAYAIVAASSGGKLVSPVLP